MTAKLMCKCTHKGQDKMYGKRKRLFNRMTKGAAQGQAWYRCTVCDREKLL